MRLRNGHFECRNCGAILDVPTARSPVVEMRAHSGRPNVRVIHVDGVVVHRCEIVNDEAIGAPDSNAVS